MTIALRRALQTSVPQTSFGPFRLVHALPWLILASALEIIAFGGGVVVVALPALVIANLAVLQAFILTAQRSIEIAGVPSRLGDLDFADQCRLSRGLLWRLVLLMFLAVCATILLGFEDTAPSLYGGIDGMAFDHVATVGKFWSATIAALVLLILLRADQNGGKVAFFAAVREFARRWFWLGGTVLVLGIAYVGLGVGQELVRKVIWIFWQTSTASQFVKNLVYFVFIFGFAMLRLWMTLLVLTCGLKWSYGRIA